MNVIKHNFFNKIIYLPKLIISQQTNPKINAMDYTPALNESSNQIENQQNLPDDCIIKKTLRVL